MDIVLLTLGFILCILGVIGSFLPVLPGPVASWTGLLLLYLTNKVENNYWVLGITLIVTITISVLDYVIPAQGTKKFGGSKYGILGTNIGLVIGLFLPPFGFILGPFVGAFIGEFLYNSNDKKGALKAAVGSFIGFVISTFMKVMVCISFTLWFVYVAWSTFA